ncbi:MAG: DUF4446 family protein [Patescibacteria group bacterium]|nr:DUF4446 family protein [Patescibacteria group bacterium]
MFELFKKEDIDPKNWKQVIGEFKSLKKEFRKVSKELDYLKKESVFSVQKMGVVRFNPFKDLGGNQSFSIALLDGNNNGVVITSFYSREGNRMFGKPIKKGHSHHSLSEEEKKAIEIAKKTRIKRKEI